MKKRMSLSFFLILILTILSLFAISDTVFALTTYDYSLFTIVRNIISMITPLALLLLLFFNTKRNVQILSTIVLVICGCTILSGVAQRITNSIGSISDISILIFVITDLTQGVLFILSAIRIRSSNLRRPTEAFAIFTFLINLAPLLVLYGSMLDNVCTLLLVAGLAFFPDTVRDYENCKFIGKKAITTIGISFAVLLVLLVLFSIPTSNNSSDSSSCSICGGSGLVNTGFVNFKTCPVCKGSGRDFH